MSSQPNVPEPRRQSYDALFGDAPDDPEPHPVAVPEEPLSYDDPADGIEPYRPPGAQVAGADAAPAGADSSWHGDPARAARAGTPVDTGRLYHSAGAAGTATADVLPALPATVPPAVAPAVEVAAGPDERAAPGAPDEVAPDPVPTRFEGVAPERTDGAAAAATPRAAPDPAAATRGLTYLGVVTVVGVPTLLVGLAQALIWNRIGWLTGLVLLATSCYAAATVRRPDFSAAIVVPPLAFLVTTLVAGQFALGDGSSLLVRETFVIVRTLAENAPWVLGATAISALIVFLRRRRA